METAVLRRWGVECLVCQQRWQQKGNIIGHSNEIRVLNHSNLFPVANLHLVINSVDKPNIHINILKPTLKPRKFMLVNSVVDRVL